MLHNTWTNQPRIGIAYSSYTPTFLREYSDIIDYVEVPFELLRHDPSVIEVSALKPIVLHCASLSIAGAVPPSVLTVKAIQDWIERTQTPWLGEHLSFITAEREQTEPFADEYAPGEPYNIGYTVSPPLNATSLRQVLQSIQFCKQQFNVPLLLENPPLYFRAPGSTMTQVEFIRELCLHSSVHLLLDLARFYISSRTMNFDPCREIANLPLERVVEVHISGVDIQVGGYWDNHASRAPEVEFELLALVLARGQVRGITLEYNWSSRFPAAVLLDEIARTRKVITAMQ